jgi:uncharacterized protein
LIDLREKDGAVVFTVRVVPRSAKSGLVGEHNGALKVRLAALPVDGAANEELIKLLAKEFDVAKSSVEILSGLTSKTKTIAIAHISPEKLTSILQAKI